MANAVGGLLAVFVLVFINGFFVAAEFALVGSRRTRIAQLAEEGHAGAVAAQQAINHLDNYIAATQLGITLASLGLGWIGEPAIGGLLESLFEAVLPHHLAVGLGHGFAIAVGFALVTMLHITFGELAPKSIALQYPEGTSIIVARPTTVFFHVFRPVIWIMNEIGNGVVRLMGFQPASGHEHVHSAEELGMLVHSAYEAGLIEDTEEQLLQAAFDFGDIYIHEVMQPRVEVDAIAVDAPFRVVLEKVSTGPYSRYPVYRDSIDRVVGVLHTKDLFDLIVHKPELLAQDVPDAPLDLSTVLRTPLFFPERASVDRVLEQMKRRKMHFAVVIDEFGGMAGIATMEDILEELVGEVQDEFDLEAAHGNLDDAAALIDGLTSMHDVTERFGEPGGSPQSATIGGYVAERLDRIPIVGDCVPFGELRVRVEEMDEMRVARVRFVTRDSGPDGCRPGDSAEGSVDNAGPDADESPAGR